jgi:hypothetical protein
VKKRIFLHFAKSGSANIKSSWIKLSDYTKLENLYLIKKFSLKKKKKKKKKPLDTIFSFLIKSLNGRRYVMNGKFKLLIMLT